MVQHYDASLGTTFQELPRGQLSPGNFGVVRKFPGRHMPVSLAVSEPLVFQPFSAPQSFSESKWTTNPHLRCLTLPFSHQPQPDASKGQSPVSPPAYTETSVRRFQKFGRCAPGNMENTKCVFECVTYGLTTATMAWFGEEICSESSGAFGSLITHVERHFDHTHGRMLDSAFKGVQLRSRTLRWVVNCSEGPGWR